jgi:hypothetical protein
LFYIIDPKRKGHATPWESQGEVWRGQEAEDAKGNESRGVCVGEDIVKTEQSDRALTS